MANKHVNAVVIGAGAGGGVVAKELSVGGLTVVLFERGRWHTFDEHGDDELTSQRTFPLKCGYGPDNEHNWRMASDGNWTMIRLNGNVMIPKLAVISTATTPAWSGLRIAIM